MSGLLFLHHEIRKTYLQLGRTFQLPHDIINYIYRIDKEMKRKEEKRTRNFHENILLLNVMVANPIHIKNKEKLHDKKINLYGCDKEIYMDEKPFHYRLPIGRGYEWAIRNTSNKKIMKSPITDELLGYRDIREKLFLEINIIGEEKYLLKGPDVLEYADRRLRILYLNKSCFDEVYIDYTNYVQWKDTELLNSYRLKIDEYGDSCFI